MTITPENPAAQEIDTKKAFDLLLQDQTDQIRRLEDRIANLEVNEGTVLTQIITKLYDNTLSDNGSWNVQNSDLIAGVGNLADYDKLEIHLFDIRSTAAVSADVAYLLYGTGGGALDTTAANYDNQSVTFSGAATSPARADTPRIAEIDGASSDANMFTDFIITIFGPGNSKFKNAYSEQTNRRVAATHALAIEGHNWENTGTITRIGVRTDNDPTDLIASGGRMVILGYNF